MENIDIKLAKSHADMDDLCEKMDRLGREIDLRQENIQRGLDDLERQMELDGTLRIRAVEYCRYEF